MEPKFQSSFIPKGPVSQQTSRPVNPTSVSIGFLSTIGTVLFILSLLASAGLFGYEHILNSQIGDSSKSLDLAKSEFDLNTLNQIIVASNQIQSAKTLLSKHIAVSNIFALLEAHVLPQVDFTTFDFDRSDTGTITVNVSGDAASYAVLAEQSALFNALPYFKNNAFSGLQLSDKGTVSMKFQTTIDPTIVSYQKALDNLNSVNPVQQQSVVQTQTVSTSTTSTFPTNSLKNQPKTQ